MDQKRYQMPVAAGSDIDAFDAGCDRTAAVFREGAALEPGFGNLAELCERDVDRNANVDAALVQRGHKIERGRERALRRRLVIDEARFRLQSDGESHGRISDLRLR